MANVFYKMECLSESPKIDKVGINRLFNAKDNRYTEKFVQRFISINKEVLDFLEVKVVSHNTDSDYCIQFLSSRYIGAFPVKSPLNGKIYNDFQIVPRYSTQSIGFSEITEIVSKIGHEVEPEFLDGKQLHNLDALRPPLYYEAAKYLDFLWAVRSTKWNKFQKVYRVSTIPKGSTDWAKYSTMSANPRNIIQYPCNDNVLSRDHQDWRGLKYTFFIARSELQKASTPSRLRWKYQCIASEIEKDLANISLEKTSGLKIKSSDPLAIRQLKHQANIVLSQNATIANAWRIDIAELFERYTQHIIKLAVTELGGVTIANDKISGSDRIPKWGLKYIEPDITVKLGSQFVFIDAKYKSNMYAYNKNSEILKETHRDDLHQILSYCSFSDAANKTGMIVYPSNEYVEREISYKNKYSNVKNEVYLIGIPFECNEMLGTKQKLQELFLNILQKQENCF